MDRASGLFAAAGRGAGNDPGAVGRTAVSLGFATLVFDRLVLVLIFGIPIFGMLVFKATPIRTSAAPMRLATACRRIQLPTAPFQNPLLHEPLRTGLISGLAWSS